MQRAERTRRTRDAHPSLKICAGASQHVHIRPLRVDLQMRDVAEPVATQPQRRWAHRQKVKTRPWLRIRLFVGFYAAGEAVEVAVRTALRLVGVLDY